MVRKDGKQYSLINLMIQLQELYIALAQQEQTTSNKARIKQLKDSIEGLSKELPIEYRATFTNLVNKGGIGIAPVNGSNCSACAMNLPISLVNIVKVADTLCQCPSCARFLYHSDRQPRGVPRKMKRSDVRLSGIIRFSSPTLMIPGLKSVNRDEVLKELSDCLAVEGFVDDGEKLYDEALKREAVMTTAVGNFIAFPHVRGVEGGGLTLAVATHKKGIDFGSPDNKLTRLFFFMSIPTSASIFYMKLLAGLNQAFSGKEVRDALIKAETQAEMWAILNKATSQTIS